jgi:autophagy-related protein 2
VQSLHLTFHISPNTHVVASEDPSNLAESVASVAESFYHDELNAEEEARLKASFHPDILSSEHNENQVPGSLDPFLDSPKHADDPLGDDPSGVSIFASLIERLLARLAFDARDVIITLVHPDHSSITLFVDEIVYGTEKRETDADDLGSGSSGEQNRNLSIAGFHVMIKPLISQSLPNPPHLRDTRNISKPPSPASSSSSLDDETQMMMSQSLAFLPPRPASPSESMSESMYKSAISTVSTGDSSHSPPLTPRQPTSGIKPLERSEGSSLPQTSQVQEAGSSGDLVFAFDSEPIMIRLTTPSAMTARLAAATAPRTNPLLPGGEQLRLTLSCGVLTCALRPHQVRMISDVAALWGSHKSPVPPSSKPSTGLDIAALLSNLGLEAKAQIRGVMVLLLHPNQPSDPALVDFFSRPFAPLNLFHGFVRLYIEKIALSSTISTPTLPKFLHTRSTRTSPSHPTLSSELTIHDISVFMFSVKNNPDKQLLAFPILITDPNLVHQYPSHLTSPSVDRSGAISNYANLPKFDVADWTDAKLATNSAKISAWRSRRRQSEHTRGNSQSPMSGLSPLSPLSGLIGSPLSIGDAINATAPAIRVSHELSLAKAKGANSVSPENRIDVAVASLHIFADLALLLSPEFSSWIKDAFESKTSISSELVATDNNKNDSTNLDSSLPTPIVRNTSAGRERERQRLERLVMDDLDLEIDYRESRLITVENTTPKQKRNKVRNLITWR